MTIPIKYTLVGFVRPMTDTNGHGWMICKNMASPAEDTRFVAVEAMFGRPPGRYRTFVVVDLKQKAIYPEDFMTCGHGNNHDYMVAYKDLDTHATCNSAEIVWAKPMRRFLDVPINEVLEFIRSAL